MRAFLMIIGVVLAVLLAGRAFAMPHDCGHAAIVQGETSAHVSHVAPDAPAKTVPADCCRDAGTCRMSACAVAILLPAPVLASALPSIRHRLPEEAASLTGRAIPPLLGPPKQILS